MKSQAIGKSVTSRRGFIKTFIKTVIAAGIVAVVCSLIPVSSGAETREYILIGHPAPITGPIAVFGETATFIDEFAAAEINSKGGIFVKDLGKKLPVKFVTVDTESNPTKAADIASKLILKDKVDVMISAGTPDTINPVSAISERYHVPCVSTFGPIEPWLTGGPYQWAFLFFVSVDQLINNHIGVWDTFAGKHNKVVGGIWPNDPDGAVFSKLYKEAAEKRGYKVVDVGRFPYGLQDFSAFINTWKKEKVEILEGVPIPPDFAALWRQCRQLGFYPKIATISKAILFPDAVAAIGGDLPRGLMNDILWSPKHPFNSSLTGISCSKLADAWTNKTKKQWTGPLGTDYALVEVIVDAIQRAGSLDKQKVRDALAQTDLKTIVGPIKFNKDNYALTPLLIGQWAKGKKWPWDVETVYNKEYPSIPTTSKPVFPLPQK